jgi:hypothetical protein
MTDTDDQGSTTDTSTTSQGTDAPVTSGTDPTQTQHPAGQEQAEENQETESPA